MPDHGETGKTILDTIIYAGGTVLGIAAKLADMHRRKNITKKDVIVNSVIAMATAFSMFWLLTYAGVNTTLANFISVFCGRFSDDVLKLLWRYLQKGMGWEEKIKKD